MAKRFLLSDASINSYGTRIDMAKIKLARFNANPVMLYNHDQLIGKWENIALEDGKLYGEPVFMEGDGETLAAQIKKRVEDGFLSGASIGFHIQDVGYDEENIPLLTVDVLECSIVDVPANANAMVLYSQDGVRLTGKDLESKLSGLKKSKPSLIDMELTTNTMSLLGLSGKPNPTQIDAAVAALAKERDDFKAENEAVLTAQIDKLIADGIATGKCKAEERTDLEAVGKVNIDLLEKTLSMRGGRQELPTAGVKGSQRLDAGEDRSGWTFDDWRKKDVKGLLSLKATNDPAYQKLLQTAKI